MKYPALAMVLSITVWFGAGRADATEIWNTFTPTNTYNTTSPWWQYTAIRDYSFTPTIVESAAMAFTTSGQYWQLDQIELGVTCSDVFTGQVLRLEILDDAGGSPGSLLEAFTLDGLVPQGAPGGGAKPPLVVASIFRPLLQPNSQYWLTLSVPPNAYNRTYNYWWENDIGFTGPTGRMIAPATTWTTSVAPQSAFRVSATSVPEPTALLPLLAPFCVAACCRRGAKAKVTGRIISQVLVIFFVAIIVGCARPPGAGNQPPPAHTPAIAQGSHSLTTGVSRSDVEAVFRKVEMPLRLEPSTPVRGQARLSGSFEENKVAHLELIGDENDLATLTMVSGIVKDNAALNISTSAIALGLIQAALPEWHEKVSWLTAVFQECARRKNDYTAEKVLQGKRVRFAYYRLLGMFSLTINSEHAPPSPA